MVGLGLFGLVMGIILIAIGFNAPNSIPGRGYYNVEAEFANADNISNHGQVRLGGRIVGQVLNPRVEDGKAIIDLQIDPEYGPLPADTKAEVRPRSAVGVRYVDLTAGSSARTIEDGGRIPASQTASTTTLDEVLGTFDSETQRLTQRFLRGFGTGFAGRGEDISDTLGEGPEALRGVENVLGAVADREGATRNLIRGGATAASAADPVRDAIRDGFDPEAKALRPFSDRGDSLRGALEAAPSSLTTLSGRLPSVTALAGELEGLGREARPLLASSPGAFSQTSALLREARPGLRDANTTLRTAQRAVDPTLALLRTVKPLLPQVDSTVANATPIAERLGAHGCDIIAWGRSWQEIFGYGNSRDSYLRFNVISPGTESVLGLGEALDVLPVVDAPYPGPCEGRSIKIGGTR